MTVPLEREFAKVREGLTFYDIDRTPPGVMGDADAALSVIERHVREMESAMEDTVTALLPLLPLRGSWNAGYTPILSVQTTLHALPEEWAEAAHQVARLHAALPAQEGAEA